RSRPGTAPGHYSPGRAPGGAGGCLLPGGCQGWRRILTMAAVAERTVRMIPERRSAGRAVQVPSQAASPVIAAPPSVALALAAFPGSWPARVMTWALCGPGPGGAIVTAASAACCAWVLLMMVR